MPDDQTWSDIAKEIAESAASEIPEIGGLLSLVLSLAWPSDSASIWDKIKEEVKALVDAEILKTELQSAESGLDDMHTKISDYLSSKPTEQGNLLDIAISTAETLFSSFTGSANAIHLIPPTVALSQIHMSLLAERNAHGAVAFNQPYDPEWAQKITQWRTLYRLYFRSIYPPWLIWRRLLISGDSGSTTDDMATTIWGTASDSLTGETLKWSFSGSDADGNLFRGAVDAAVRRMQRAAIAEMAGALASTFVLNLYDPSAAGQPAEVDPSLAYISLGPFSAASLGHQYEVKVPGMDGAFSVVKQSYSAPAEAEYFDVPGRIAGFEYEPQSLSAFQIGYSDHDGCLLGDPSRGKATTMNSPYSNGFAMLMWPGGGMTGWRAAFSDGTWSPSVGLIDQLAPMAVNGTVDRSYALVGIEAAPPNAQPDIPADGTLAIGLMTLKFAHSSLDQVTFSLKTRDGGDNEILKSGEHMVSASGLYYCIMQADGNLCIHAGSVPPDTGPCLWQSNTHGPVGSYFCLMSSDGNLYIHEGADASGAGAAIWASGQPRDSGPYFTILTDEGRLSICSGTPDRPGARIWWSQ